jgi:predicted kinase
MFLFMRPRSVTVPLDWATVLIVLSGLPGTGKTTVARELARQLVAVHLRIDSIEQSIRDIGRAVEDLGYRVAYAVAEDNLRLGHIVVADCVNPWPLTRSEWRAVAERTGAPILDVEIVCSDPHEHRRRVETRAADIVGHTLPTWKDVIERDYRPWNTQRTVVDTARLSVEQSVRAILGKVRTDRAS